MRLPAPHLFMASCLELRRDDEVSPDEIRRHLADAGYVEDDPVTEPGEFSLRGGILDVFSPQLGDPARLEFFGDRLESLRLFDVETQRSVEPLERVEIVPMREQSFSQARLLRWAEEALRHWSPAFHADLEQELASARAGEAFPGAEFLLAEVEPLEGTLFDYVAGFRIAVLDREVTEAALERHHAELYERYVDRVEARKAVAAPDHIYLTVEDLRGGLERAPLLGVEELSVEGDGGAPQLFLSSQMTRKYHGNIRELVGDVAKLRAAGERLVFLFPNLGRAERVAEILKEYELPVHLCRGDEDDPAPQEGAVVVGVGFLRDGFFLPAARLRALTGYDVFDESEVGEKFRSPPTPTPPTTCSISHSTSPPRDARGSRSVAPSSRTFATCGRAITSCTSTTGSGSSTACAASRSRGGRRSSCCSPTRTKPGSTSRSSGST